MTRTLGKLRSCVDRNPVSSNPATPLAAIWSPDTVAKATARAGQRGLPNVRFVAGDIHDPAPGGPFDAIIGRLVLMYVPDPAAVLRTQASVLRPGGVVAPIESDLHSARSLPSTPMAG